jgi:hypothetical protein
MKLDTMFGNRMPVSSRDREGEPTQMAMIAMVANQMGLSVVMGMQALVLTLAVHCNQGMKKGSQRRAREPLHNLLSDQLQGFCGTTHLLDIPQMLGILQSMRRSRRQ